MTHRAFPLLIPVLSALTLAWEAPHAERAPGPVIVEPPRALPRTLPHPVHRDAGEFVLTVGPPTPIPASSTRSGETFCDGQWQNNGLGVGYYPTWFGGDEFYAAYQDPQTLGSCAGLGGAYDFDVTNIRWWVFEQDGGTSYDFQPLVYDDAGGGSCPVPGNVVCAGPMYLITLPQTTSYVLDLPLTTACCVNGPYFAGVYSPTVPGSGVLGLVAAEAPGSATLCRVYNDWQGSWEDLADHLSTGTCSCGRRALPRTRMNAPEAPGIVPGSRGMARRPIIGLIRAGTARPTTSCDSPRPMPAPCK